jgi:type II secretory pathway pseudopilin PulG
MKAGSSGFGPSLIELVAAVLLFALCSAVCVRIFAGAKQISDDAADLSRAAAAAQSAAECFKSCGGDAAGTARLLGGSSEGAGFSVYYDEGWILADSGKYSLCGKITEEHGLRLCQISVTDGKKEIFGMTAASHCEVMP